IQHTEEAYHATDATDAHPARAHLHLLRHAICPAAARRPAGRPGGLRDDRPVVSPCRRRLCADDAAGPCAPTTERAERADRLEPQRVRLSNQNKEQRTENRL